MPVVVPCPKCAAKLKAPDNLAGKKVKCKGCGTSFRIPGVPVAESVGDADIPVAEFIDDGPAAVPVPSAKPAAPPPAAKPVAALASADAFDFSKPAPAAPAAKPPAPVPAPAARTPAAPAPKPAAVPVPAAAPAAPKPAPVAKAAPPAPKPVEPPPPVPVADLVPAAEPAGDEMFAFGNEPAAPKKKKRDEDDEDRPAKGKKKQDEDEAPKKKARRDDEDDEDEDERPKGKSKAAPTESYNPFDNYPTEPEPEPEKKPRKRKGKDGEDEDEDEPEKPRYLSPAEKGSGTGKALMTTAVIGIVAALLGIAATIVYIKNDRKQREEAAAELAKAAEKEKERLAAAGVAPAGPAAPDQPKGPAPIPDPPRPSIPDPPRADGKKDKVDPKVDPKVNPKVDPKVDPKVNPKVDPKVDPKVNPPKEAGPRPKDPGPKGATLKLPPKLRQLALGNPPAKGEKADDAQNAALMDTPFAQVVRVFAPAGATDRFVLSRTGPAGKGEKFALDTVAKANVVPTARVTYDGDGNPDVIADVFATADAARFLAAPGGRLHVWDLSDKKKLADGLDPYFDTPHAAAGLAAAFLTADPNLVVTVSTAGAVHLYDVVARKAISEFIPPNGAPGRVALGLSVAKDDAGASVAVAVGGGIYQLEAKPGLQQLKSLNLGGDVNRSLGLAVKGSPGRILYAFEAVADGKKEKAVLDVPQVAPKGGGAIIHGLPDALGDPKGAMWAGDFGGLILDRGVLWFDDRENRFIPALVMQPPVPYAYAGVEGAVWCAVSQANGTKSALMSLEVPFSDFRDPVKAIPATVPAYRLSPAGLAK